MEIKIDDLTGAAITRLLSEHQDRMAENSPPESRHVLDIEALRNPDITFWSLWDAENLMGCVALKHWDESLAELKSMKTAPTYIRRGVGKHLLEHVLKVAHQRGYSQLKLETGSMAYFTPARKLYSQYGFETCLPFCHYQEDENSVFMCLTLE